MLLHLKINNVLIILNIYNYLGNLKNIFIFSIKEIYIFLYSIFRHFCYSNILFSY